MDTVILYKAEARWPASQRVWLATARLAGAFVVVLAVLMGIAHWQAPAHDPLTASSLIAAKDALHLNRRDESRMAQYRELDLQTRRGFFTRLDRNKVGGWLLVGGLVVFVIASRQVTVAQERPPNPMSSGPSAPADDDRRWALASVGGVGALALSALVLGAATGRIPNLQTLSVSSVPAGPTEAELRANWPRFRGADGSGVALSSNLPTSFNVETGENLLWKTELPLPGVNSPVIWGNRIFFTGSVKQKRELFCFDANSGALLWRLPVVLLSDAAVDAMNISEPPGVTAPTVATDGQRVYAMFSTGEIMAADFAGKQAWAKALGKPDNLYGHASSLVTWRDRVLLQFDQAEVKSAKSRLVAFDGRTGNILWQQPRPVAAAWTTPVIARFGGAELLVTLSEPFVIAHELESGKELWRFGGFGVDLVPSPIAVGELVIAADAGRQLIAIKPGGSGDVTLTHGVWTNQVSDPDICSPVANGELLFTLGSGGNLTCYQSNDGKQLWEHNFKVEFHASPVLAGPWLYLFSVEGDMVVVKAAREFVELGRSKLGEPVSASPAVARDRLYVRGEKHLFCVGAGKVVADAR